MAKGAPDLGTNASSRVDNAMPSKARNPKKCRMTSPSGCSYEAKPSLVAGMCVVGGVVNSVVGGVVGGVVAGVVVGVVNSAVGGVMDSVVVGVVDSVVAGVMDSVVVSVVAGVVDSVMAGVVDSVMAGVIAGGSDVKSILSWTRIRRSLAADSRETLR